MEQPVPISCMPLLPSSLISSSYVREVGARGTFCSCTAGSGGLDSLGRRIDRRHPCASSHHNKNTRSSPTTAQVCAAAGSLHSLVASLWRVDSEPCSDGISSGAAPLLRCRTSRVRVDRASSAEQRSADMCVPPYWPPTARIEPFTTPICCRRCRKKQAAGCPFKLCVATDKTSSESSRGAPRREQQTRVSKHVHAGGSKRACVLSTRAYFRCSVVCPV